ncbi:hypothetical protein DFA_10866 [Cavenderia fasciculata]|uniref:inorganic diphosphatase n=1 Tax=Cavenderia fasciculata TaxID=261658 RepID=F4QBM0_CACFS|nr:uncharacterized protein DFA_10866 [Cavenderia fasciculata]EGG14608.1 hypothetical protein DFA_10866 [Cavenderia fasciculata]|eukprot:XP_004351116.1 hypothetical protein DFA_10866 [Cavenderia fasciculata]
MILNRLSKVLPLNTNNVNNTFLRYYSTKSNSTGIVAKEEGTVGTFEYRVKFFKDSKQISPWHEVPLHSTSSISSLSSSSSPLLFNFINEMPKNSNAKMEVNTKEQYNPIKQDIKKQQLRYIKHGNLLFNYGCLPQTWENPNTNDTLTNMPGDNDPLDVVEVGSSVLARGEITPVKVLGALALIDEGETDWKVIAININDENASKINNLNELEKVLPGTVDKIRTWYKVYKVAEGKGENEYALNGQPIDHNQTIKVIEETHHAWKSLINGNTLFTL